MDDTYDWTDVATVAATPTGVPAKSDHRVVPIGHGGELVTTCGCRLATNNFRQKDCKWYAEVQHITGHCKYDRFGILCDKVLDSNGKEIN